MEMQEVKSSQIAKIGHDPAMQTLEIHFHGGGKYQYADVPAEEHRAPMDAPSIGSHFHKRIKQGGFKYTKLDQ